MRWLSKSCGQSPHSDASFFSDVLLDDGSSFAVANGLKKVFPGRFTKIKPAAVELHAHMSLLGDQLVSVTIAPDKEAERQFLPLAASLPARSLSLRDRGYIDLAYFEALEARKNGPAYLICRANDKINPVVEEIRGVSRKIAKKWEGKHLQVLPKSLLRGGVDLLVSWPRRDEKTLHLRLVVRYLEPKPGKKRARGKKRLTAKEERYAMKNRWAFLLTSLCAALIKRALAHSAQLAHGCAISVRIAAQSGPQLLPRLADWLEGACIDAVFVELLSFLANNAKRAHPRRDKRRPQHKLGLHWVTEPAVS